MTLPPRRPRPGDWVLMFGTASKILGVGSHPEYPTAILVRMTPAGSTVEVETLVPVDYEPLILDIDRRTRILAGTGPSSTMAEAILGRLRASQRAVFSGETDIGRALH